MCLAADFKEGKNYYDFLFASEVEETIPRWGLLLKDRICS